MRVKLLTTRPEATLPKISVHKEDFGIDLTAYKVEEVAPNYYKYYLGIALQLDRDWEPERISDPSRVDYTDCCQSLNLDPVYIKLQTCPLKFAFQIFPRSSVWKHGMLLTNSVGIVDEGYTGEITALFYHYDQSMPIYEVGDKVVQMALTAGFPVSFSSVPILDKTTRGSGAYGSTGK